MESYSIGDGQIFLTADISADGPAASRASVLDIQGSTPSKTVAVSENATGDIPRQDISGKATLKDRRLTVFTKIALIGANANTRRVESNAVTGEYILDGGTNGSLTFPPSTIDYIDPNVFLRFEIDLI